MARGKQPIHSNELSWSEMADFDVDDSLLGVGLYAVTEAARIISYSLEMRVSATNLRRWAFGRRVLVKEYAPIIAPRIHLDDAYLFTFEDLIELITIAELRRRGMKMSAVKAAHQHARERFGEHPFAKRQYSLHGKKVFERKQSYEGSAMEDLVTLQRAFEDVIKPLLSHIVVYVGDLPRELTPLGRERSVVLDPERAFGTPINRETGVPTTALYGMHKAGETPERIAKWYGMPLSGVEDGIKYQAGLLEAA